MKDFLERTELLLGNEKLKKLKTAHVAVFGVGGVGSYAAEALIRSGIGNITFIDGDRYAVSNMNRQLYATLDTLGEYKAESAVKRAAAISPQCNAVAVNRFYTPDTADMFDLGAFDYIIDAIDSVKDKTALIAAAHATGTPIISSMGAGNKLDPTGFRVADIADTSVCPLARIMRKQLRQCGILHTKTVYSPEKPLKPDNNGEVPGSVSFVPSVAGLIIAGEVIKDIAG